MKKETLNSLKAARDQILDELEYLNEELEEVEKKIEGGVLK